MSDFVWHWPQILACVNFAILLLINAVFDGKPRMGKYSLALQMLDVTIASFVLYKGGFFAGGQP